MEVRDQDKEIGMMPTSLGYNHQPNRDPPTSKLLRRRDEDGLESGGTDTTTIFNNNPSQTLDHQHQFSLQHQQQQQQQQQLRTRSPNPDPDPPPPPTARSPSPPIRYRECLKNHAAGMGGHVVDGCGEFMPAGGEEGTAEALKCAACDCHRNFHRKEIHGGEPPQYNSNSHHYHHPLHNNNNNNNPNKNSSSSLRTNTAPPLLSHPPPSFFNHHHNNKYYNHHHGSSSANNHLTSPAAAQPMMMAFGGAPAEYSSSEDLNNVGFGGVGGVHRLLPTSKKRFRTKFSKEQKVKMMGIAEKLEWKIQKQDEQEVDQFCSEVGIKRQVFKVWMHNNKQAMKKKQQQQQLL